MTKLKTILIVDDDPDDVFLFEDCLRNVSSDVELHTAEDGAAALAWLQNNLQSLPDVIFLDLNMPRMDGKQCLLEIKRQEELKGIPVFIYTTSSNPKDIEDCLNGGAKCVITKPTDVDHIKEIIKPVCDYIHGRLADLSQWLSSYDKARVLCRN